MAADWYCEIEGEQYGPITAGQLKQLATEGKLQPSHSVWKEGMNVNVPARTVKGLFDSAPAAAPSSAPAPAPAPAAAPGKWAAANPSPSSPSTPSPEPATTSSAASTAKQLASLGEPEKPEEELSEFEMISEPVAEEPIEFEMITEEEETVEEFEVVEKEDEEEEEEEPKPRKKPSESKREKEEEDEEEEPKPRKKSSASKREKEEEEEEAEVLAEVAITYREGYPDLDGPLEGQLTLESTGLRFQFEDEEEFRLSFEKVEDILEPAKGDFPPSMKKKALGKKLGGKAGKLAAGMLGKWLGGDAGEMVGKAGKAAGDLADKSGDLGKPPRNRIVVYARIKKERCKIRFDTSGDDSDEMTQEAKVLFKQIQKAKSKAESTAAAGGDANINIVVNEASGGEKESKPGSGAARLAAGGAVPAPIAPVAGKPFRVMNGGSVRGPFSLDELRGLVSSGNLGGDALIGVETWLPLSTMGSLLGGASTNGTTAGSSTAAEDEEQTEEEQFEDFEEVPEEEETENVEEEEEPEPPPPPRKDDEGSLPMDEEFKL